MENALRIHEKDTVAVALKALAKGEKILGVTLLSDISAGHKFALAFIPAGQSIIKYGQPIGHALSDIQPGEHVHTQNLKTNLSEQLSYDYAPVPCETEEKAPHFFKGFLRENGKAGIRNDIWIIPTVGCVNGIAQNLARAAGKCCRGSVENVIAFAHPYGCSQMGEDQEITRKILADLCAHPNAGGVLLLGLGCENSGIDTITPYLGDHCANRIRTLICQEAEDEMEAGLALLKELIDQAAKDERQDISTEKLVIGLKCGGSDGFSGITANPAIGVFSDLLIARGGATILTEVPEMFGAETLLMARCENEELFRKTVCLINDFKQYYEDHHQPVYENPSPGNKAGGISTLEDKALGCTQKSGSAPVKGVLAYGERVEKPGLHLLSAPGNDLVASTALAAAGAQIVLFSTGRGTPFGCPVPTVKISSNSALAGKKGSWIDFDAGRLLSGMTLSELGEELYRDVLSIAEGKQTKNEIYGIFDLAIFKQGVTL